MEPRALTPGTRPALQSQNTRTLSTSAASLAASGGVVHWPFTLARSSSVAPRATAHPFQT